MIDNTNKVAAIFGVRNEASIAWAIAIKLHQSGCKVALSYVGDTKDEVLHLMQQNGMDSALSAEDIQLVETWVARLARRWGC